MRTTSGYRLLLIFLVLVPRPAVADNLEVLDLFGLYEKTLPVDGVYKNPFRTGEVAVDALIRMPSGAERVHPCFYYVPCSKQYEPYGATRRIVPRPAQARGSWRLRFTPSEPGLHSVRIRIRDREGERLAEVGEFRVEASDRNGFIRQRGRGFFFDNGERYYPIGFEQAWSQPNPEKRAAYSWGNGQDSIDGFRWFFREAGRHGANWNRLWIDCSAQGSPWARPSVQWKPGEISQGDSWLFDDIVNNAERYGIGLQVMIGRYNQTLQEYRDYVRYLVARWGYSTAIFAWELKNENWWTDVHGYTDELLWTKDMASLIREQDPYDHLIVTSHWEDAVKEKAPIYRLDEIAFYSDHKYFIDELEDRVWRLTGDSPHVSEQEHRSGPSAMRLYPGADTVHGPEVAVAEGKTYQVQYWLKTRDVAYTGRLTLAFRFMDKDGRIVGETIESRIPQGSADWQLREMTLRPPEGLAVSRMKIYMEQSAFTEGEAFVDDLVIEDSAGDMVLREFFTWGKSPDLSLVRRIFDRGRWLESFNLESPVIGGEHGLKTEVNYRPFRSPYVHGLDERGAMPVSFRKAWDQKGQHAREWLWAAAMGWDGATGMWWWMAGSLKHTLAVRRYMDAVGPEFHDLPRTATWEPSPRLTSNNNRILACGRVGPDSVYAFVFHRDSTWDRILVDGVEAEAVSGEVSADGRRPGAWNVVWYDSRYTDVTGAAPHRLKESRIKVGGDGQLRIPIEELTGDIAIAARRAGE